MNLEQKEYTILEIRKNNKEIKSLNERAKSRAFLVGVASLSIIISIFDVVLTTHGAVLATSTGDPMEWSEIIKSLLSMTFGVGLSVYGLKSMLENLAQKAGLDSLNKKLEYELKIDEIAEKSDEIAEKSDMIAQESEGKIR